MRKELLLPYGFKKIGWAILIPTLLLSIGLLICTYGFDIDFDESAQAIFKWLGLSARGSGEFLASTNAGHWINNICIFGLVVGALFVGCSRERAEDEMIASIRLNALLIALWINYGILLVAALLVYDLDFINVMIYNLFTMLAIFVAVFRWKLWRLRKEAVNEE